MTTAQAAPICRFGYRPDHPLLKTQRHSHQLLTASPVVAKSASQEQYEGPIVNQQYSSSCPGGGTAQQLWTGYNAAGKPLPFFPSPDGIYKNTRVLERRNANFALTDSGAMPSDIMRALSSFGVRKMRAPTPDGRIYDIWTSDDVANTPNAPPPNVNLEPTLSELEEEGMKLVTGEYRVDENAADAITQICAAICGAGLPKGLVLGIGIFVDYNFMNWTPNKGPLDGTPDFKDPNGGGHWLCLDSYDGFKDGAAGLLRGPNSWGTSWGDSGHFEITSKRLMASVSDIYIFNTEVAA